MQRKLFLLLCGAVLVGLSIFQLYTPLTTYISTLDSSNKQKYLYNDSTSVFKESVVTPLNLTPRQSSIEPPSSTTTTTTTTTPTPTPTSTSTSVALTTHGSTTFLANATALYLSTRFVGRLGNQMFIYATMVGLARAQHRVPFVKNGGDLLKTFQISNVRTDLNTDGWNVISESAYAVFDSKFMKLPMKNLIITGYLQSWRYFHHAQEEIRREFTFVPSIQKEAQTIVADYRSKFENHVVVGVHVRRGDFVQADKQNYGYGVAGASYFVKAFAKMRSLIPNQNITFLVASDDLQWCKENLNDSSVRFLSEGNAGNHFAILSSCDHVILTGGTFGWWIAWLANGITIYYKDFIKKNTPLQAGFNDRDYYPPGWIGLEN